MTFDLAETIQLLSSTPDALRSLLQSLPEDWARTSDEPGSWAPFDVIGHLLHGEETDWLPRAEIILAQAENTTFVPFDRFIQFESSKGKTLTELLDQFSLLRRRNLETMRSWQLSEAQLDLPGVHPELGPVNLRQLLATWAVHDLNHLRQIIVAIAKHYEHAVGPWKQYLSILN